MIHFSHKIIHITQAYRYGSAKGIHEMIRKQKMICQDIILILDLFSLHDKGLLQELLDLGVKVRFVDSVFKRTPWGKEGICKQISSLYSKGDVIFSHGGFSSFSLDNFFPFIHVCHGFGMNRPEWVENQDKKGISAATVVIAVSKEIKNQLIQRGIHQDKIRVMYYPFSFKIFEKREKKQVQSFSLVGNFVTLKGHEYAICAFKKLIFDGYNLKLNFFGDGPLQEVFSRQVCEDGMADKIFFYGFCDQVTIWNNTDCLLVPSLQEGLGLVICEAFSRHIPVIAFQTGGIPELVEDKNTGFLAKTGDCQQFYEKMKAILGADINAMTRNARYKLLEIFSQENAEQWSEILGINFFHATEPII